jgi:uncharacterized protein (TIGR02001 family)
VTYLFLVVGTGLAALIADAARAQVPTATTGQTSGGAISLGARGWGAHERVSLTPVEREPRTIEFSAKAGVASDYIYRGTSLSDRKPAVGAGVEATYGWLYAGATAASVKLPSEPGAELTFAGGIRPSYANIDFDLGAIYFLYPGEMPGTNIDYWEASARADTAIGESFRAAGGFAYSPNVSNTGAWGWYAAAGLGYEVPARVLPLDIGVLITGAAGYSWFGNQSLALGGFELPAYLNWHAGVTFTHKFFNLDLRYHDTNLSKENCFVFTGDPNARPGGRIDPITNPTGLMSNWCSATVVAKAWIAIN